ncbi:LysR family transcriptional regulator [Andreprevotia chitinilytica]|uniref:LysR family transcriptional regulator n=1 Tax=Andreprevotia chitinilytica TaxID=396808 RepID=UPI00054DA9F9|nr:LysR family transcriptional regulator [Andreprevotia chitinilytica]
MKLDQLDGILAFVTVAQKRSFTAAAAHLEVSAPAVSQAVRTLETRLGVRLFNRTTRSVGLTEAGERFFARAAPALADLNEATADLDDFRDRPAGTLRLTLPRIAAELLRPTLTGFLSAYPQIRLDLSMDDHLVDIVEAGFDAGIRLGESVQRDMVGVPLTREERSVIVGAPGYFARIPPPQTIEDLQQHTCVRYRFLSSGVVYRWELLRDGKMIEAEIDGPITVNDGDFMKSLALDGVGLVYTLESLVAPQLERGELVPVLQDCCPTWPGFYFYYPSRKQLPAKLRCFIDYWRENRLG